MQADGWDPRTVGAGCNKKLLWRCDKGHTWLSTVSNRTPPHNRGCPVCSGNKVLTGFNDLATIYPELARQADGWDPQLIASKSGQKVSWRCDNGHTWKAVVSSRTRNGCPYCAGKKVQAGINDLATLFPELAKQADGWDPAAVMSKTPEKVRWLCDKGHRWVARISNRSNGKGCPICANKEVLKGFNDLATIYPELAREADGWDPTTETAGSGRKRPWRCSKDHTWVAVVASRSAGRGCPECAEHGFKPGQPAWFYLLHRPGEQQLGVTNEPEVRLSVHSRYGWQQLELVGPFPGDEVLALEKKLKKWLRREVGLVPGTHENWFTAKLEVNSLAQLKAVSGVETDLF